MAILVVSNISVKQLLEEFAFALNKYHVKSIFSKNKKIHILP